MSERDSPMQKVITKCWEDEAFKERLLADPAAMCVWRCVGPPPLVGVIKTVAFSPWSGRRRAGRAP